MTLSYNSTPTVAAIRFRAKLTGTEIPVGLATARRPGSATSTRPGTVRTRWFSGVLSRFTSSGSVKGLAVGLIFPSPVYARLERFTLQCSRSGGSTGDIPPARCG